MPFPIVDFVVTRHIPNATDATDQVLLIAPFDLRVVSIQARHRVASTSGTIDLKKSASGTTVTGGTSVLSATMSNSGTAETTVSGSLVTTINGTVVTKGQALGLDFAGTLTNLEDLDITVVLRQVKKS